MEAAGPTFGIYDWLPADHLRYLDRKVSTGERLRLAVCSPMRSGKSYYVGRLVPLWLIVARSPVRILLVSHAYSLAISHLRWVRRALQLWGQVELTQARDDALETAEGSSIRAFGVEASIVGHGADYLIVDDPIRTLQAARSQLQRDHLAEWFKSVALTRLSPTGSAIVLMSRWHEDDLVGRLAREGGWEIVRIPAQADSEDDPLGRSIGQWLDLPWVEDIRAYWEGRRAEVGPWAWAAHYQGNPVPPSGHIVTREHLSEVAEIVERDGERIIRAWGEELPVAKGLVIHGLDLGASADPRSDRTACVTGIYFRRGRLVLVDAIAGRWNWPEPACSILAEYIRPWGGRIWAESVGVGKAVISTMRRAGLPVHEIHPRGDKEARLASLLGAGITGRLAIVHTPGTEEMIRELLAFPGGEHDDLVDAAAYVGIRAGEVGLHA